MHAVSALLRVSIAHLCSQACSARITSAVFSEGEAFRQPTLTGNRLTLFRKPPRCSVLHASALQRSMLSEATSSRQACTSRAEGVAEVPTRWSYLVMQDSASLTGFEFEDVERTCLCDTHGARRRSYWSRPSFPISTSSRRSQRPRPPQVRMRMRRFPDAGLSPEDHRKSSIAPRLSRVDGVASLQLWPPSTHARNACGTI